MKLVLPFSLRFAGLLMYGAILAGLIYLFVYYESPDWLVITCLLVYLFIFQMSYGTNEGYIVMRKLE